MATTNDYYSKVSSILMVVSQDTVVCMCAFVCVLCVCMRVCVCVCVHVCVRA